MCFVDGGWRMVDGEYHALRILPHKPYQLFHSLNISPSTIHLPPFTSSPPLGRGRGWALEEGAVSQACLEPLDKGRL